MKIDAAKAEVFPKAKWIWSPNTRRNHYVLFTRSAKLPSDAFRLDVRISASYNYELYANGQFIRRGPVHGDPAWCQFDEYAIDTAEFGEADTLHLAAVVYHAADTPLLSQVPGMPGLIAQIRGDGFAIDTDSSWKCLDLEMWSDDTPQRGWALPYMEDYDATREPENWEAKVFGEEQTAGWNNAVEVDEAAWGNYTRRITPYLNRRLVEAVSMKTWRAPEETPTDLARLSEITDTEQLDPVSPFKPCTADAMDAPGDANAFTFDLGRERIGFYYVELDAPEGVAIDISGTELLAEGRPWVFRKGTSYTARYRTRAGRQTFRSFGWNGFRYLHIVVRAGAGSVRILRAGCVERRAPLRSIAEFSTDDGQLAEVFDLCRYTLEVGAQEHLIDCPTREQSQYWGDALFIALSLWMGFGEPSYLQWYMEAYLHVPFRPDGQIRATYPGTHQSALLDYSLIPILAQGYYRSLTDEWYKADETIEKSLKLLEWYDEHLNEQGLLDFDFEEFKAKGWVNFIDHPGIGWHNFPHPGIDRRGASAPLNMFLFGFLTVLAEMAQDRNHPRAEELAAQAEDLRDAIVEAFFDGTLYRDARAGENLSPCASWQTNSLAVYFGFLEEEDAALALRKMIDAYDSSCRCTPYFYFFMLPAMRAARLEEEARKLIVREWGTMLERDATTTWEAFHGDERDSLCHPWSTAPFLFLISEQVEEE